MSGIYVKGVVLPKEGLTEILIRSDGTALVACGPVYEDATAIQVPDHGDLIDRDDLCEALYSDCEAYADGWTFAGLWEDDKETIMRLPVVIPAERSEE